MPSYELQLAVTRAIVDLTLMRSPHPPPFVDLNTDAGLGDFLLWLNEEIALELKKAH